MKPYNIFIYKNNADTYSVSCALSTPSVLLKKNLPEITTLLCIIGKSALYQKTQCFLPNSHLKPSI